MEIEKQIPQTHIIKYIFIVAFIFAGLFSVNSKAFRGSLAAENEYSRSSK